MADSQRQRTGGRRVACRLAPPGVRTAVLAGLSALVLISGCAAGQAPRIGTNPGLPAAGAMTQDIPLSEEQLRQLQLAREVLMSDSADITDEARRNAAALLIDLGAAESRAVIEEALRSTNVAALRAVLGALTERPADAPLLDAVVGALATAPPELHDIVASVLAAHGKTGQDRVVAIAMDTQAPLEHRVQAIRALGCFRDRDGLIQLMSLLEPEREEPAEVIAAACSALQSLTGMRLDSDPEAWRAWWTEFRDKPFAEVLRITVRRLSDQMEQVQRDNARLSELYADSLREIYLLLPKEEQLNRLARDLAHELPQVRRLALERVDRLLRDQERLPDAVKDQLVQRLTDPEASHRRLAARLLDESNLEGLRHVLADVLETETDIATAQEFLRVLAKRPTADAAEAALRWLPDPVVGPNAAALLTQLAQVGSLPEETAEEARTIARALVTPTNGASEPTTAPPPAHARLLTVIGKERDLVQLEAMLDGTAPELKQAIADGLAIIGRPAPLVARAQDPVIYPHALRATAAAGTSVDTLRSVLNLTPPEQHRDLWSAELRNVAAKTPVEQALVVDDLLADVPAIDRAARVQLLQRAIDVPADQLPAALRRDVVVRSATLLLASNEPTRALELLSSLGPQPTDDAVRDLSLRAAVLTGQFDRAQEIADDPQAWIALLTQLIETHDEMAFALRREISERFLEELDEPTRAAFEAASSLLETSLEPEASVDASELEESVTP